MLTILLFFRPNADPLVLPQSSPHHPQLSQVPEQYSLLPLDQTHFRLRVRQPSWFSHEFCSIWRWRSTEQRGEQILLVRSKYSHICQILLYFSPSAIFTIPQPPAKPKGKPETGTLRKETKKEPKREEPKKEEPKRRDASPEEKIISRRKRHDSDEGEASNSKLQFFPVFLSNVDFYLHLLWVLYIAIYTLSGLLNHFLSRAYSRPFYDKYTQLPKYCTPHIFHMQTQQVRNSIYPVFAFLYFASIVGFAFSSQFKLSNFSRCWLECWCGHRWFWRRYLQPKEELDHLECMTAAKW